MLDEQLITKIKNKIRQETSPRHIPSKIYQIDEVPYTISGKKVEMAVAKILNGDVVGNKEALLNPYSLKQFERYILK